MIGDQHFKKGGFLDTFPQTNPQMGPDFTPIAPEEDTMNMGGGGGGSPIESIRRLAWMNSSKVTKEHTNKNTLQKI